MDVTRVKSGLRRVMGGVALPIPSSIPQGQHSAIYFEDNGPPTERLLDLGLAAAEYARRADLSHISERIQDGPPTPSRWPGEHYRLLAGLTYVLRPRTVIEIGTYKGLSALALEHEMPEEGVIHTFDVMPLEAIKGQTLRPEDLATGRIVPHLADLTQPKQFEKYRPLIEAADLIFVDAAKDGSQEQKFLDAFEATRFRNAPIIVFDDIRLWNMLHIWRNVRRPKMDLTSVGHWSGTGVVDWDGTPA